MHTPGPDRDELFRMARESGFNWPEIHTTTVEERLERFFRSAYATGAADERDRVAALASNARLIAKAPDLKAALAWALDQIEDDLDPDHQAALAHARSLLED